jgi:hypothetical protein
MESAPKPCSFEIAPGKTVSAQLNESKDQGMYSYSPWTISYRLDGEPGASLQVCFVGDRHQELWMFWTTGSLHVNTTEACDDSIWRNQ